MHDIHRGDRRRWVAPEWRAGKEHTVMRVSDMNAEVAIRNDDKTTSWEPLATYLIESEEVKHDNPS